MDAPFHQKCNPSKACSHILFPLQTTKFQSNGNIEGKCPHIFTCPPSKYTCLCQCPELVLKQKSSIHNTNSQRALICQKYTHDHTAKCFSLSPGTPECRTVTQDTCSKHPPLSPHQNSPGLLGPTLEILSLSHFPVLWSKSRKHTYSTILQDGEINSTMYFMCYPTK